MTTTLKIMMIYKTRSQSHVMANRLAVTANHLKAGIVVSEWAQKLRRSRKYWANVLKWGEDDVH